MNTETTIQMKTIYHGKILDLIIKDVLVKNNKTAKREVILHKPGVAILATTGSDIFLVKQFRTAIEKEILEIPAGLVENNENIYHAAHRELQEEIGYDCKDLKLLTKFYPSPGFTNEVTYVFLAKDLFESKLPEDDDENIKIIKLPITKLNNILNSDEIIDAKTLVAISLFLLNQKNT